MNLQEKYPFYIDLNSNLPKHGTGLISKFIAFKGSQKGKQNLVIRKAEPHDLKSEFLSARDSSGKCSFFTSTLIVTRNLRILIIDNFFPAT